MKDIFKIWMVSIDWEAPNRVKGITRSKKPLEREYIDGVFTFDIVTYEKADCRYFQFAIETKDQPVINQREGHYISLYEIEKDLWINKGEWKTGTTGRGYHYCPTVNTVGSLDVLINDQQTGARKAEIKIEVNPSIENFDFAELKNDFEGDLWSLITAGHAKLTTGKREIKWKETPIAFQDSQLVLSFLECFDQVIKSPKKELIHAVHRTSIDKVRPIPATYQKIAITGKQENLPSRGYRESLDNYENRALCQMLFRVSQLVNRSMQFVALQSRRVSRQLGALEQQIKELEQPQKVNPVEVKQEIARQEAFFEKWKKDWELEKDIVLANCSNENCWVSKTIEVSHDTHFGTDIWGNFGLEFGLISFPVDVSKILEGKKRQKVKIKAHCFKDKFNSAGGWPIFHVKAISSIELLDIVYPKIIARQKQNYEQLKKKNWELHSILSATEKEKLEKERKKQIRTLNKKVKRLEGQKNQFQKFFSELQLIQPEVSRRFNAKFVQLINWKNFTRFKPSMTYLQNKRYKGAFTAFQRLLDASGGDLKVFELYEEVTSYGIRDIPQVYELWCLIRVIKCLEEEYHFVHKAEDLKSLLKVLSPQNKKLSQHCTLRFERRLASRSVRLHYQKTLQDGKRPDFLLEITGEHRSISLVLDAKYKNYNYKKSVSIEAKAIAEKYGEKSSSYVFIVHPCEDKEHEEFTSVLTNLGGSTMYLKDDQQEIPLHKYGGLQLSPNKEDNLKKVIGMAFEYLIEWSTSAKVEGYKLDPIPKHDLFCLNCGSEDFLEEKKERGDDRYHYNCTCQNEDCGHEMYIDYCWNCKTRVIKHGRYWDYHRTSIWSIFDIHCPNCGMTVADYPK